MNPRSILPLFVITLFACYDPVHEDAVANLGPEVPGIPEGELHRAGQPCTTCHSGNGPGAPEFSIAGTLFQKKGEALPFVGGIVTVTDARGSVRSVTSNAAGSFRIERRQWDPIFPLKVTVKFTDELTKVMRTSLNRDGGCAACHRGRGDASLMPAIYLDE